MFQELMEMKKCPAIRRNIWILLLGVVLIVFGLMIIVNISWMFDTLVQQLIAVAPSSEATRHWSKSAKPIPMYIYFFNWTNPEDIYNPNVKPRFEEVGPYVFREFKEKINVVFNENETVSYSSVSTYFEDTENSRNFSDVITSINFVAYAASKKLKEANFFQKKIFSLYLSSISSLYIRRTVKELLFEGFKDPLLDTFNLIPPFLTGTVAPDRFGWLYGTNGSSGGNVFNMGVSKDQNYGRLYSWNYHTTNPFYEGSCREIRGTAAELYAMNRQRNNQYFFHYELCRSFSLAYERDEEINGINGYKYHLGPENFDNGTYAPENVCYCNGDCLPVGVMNLTACRQDSPIFFSLPHFYEADSYYLRALDGLNPRKDDHEFSITLEPKTGVITNVAGRIQLNVLLEPDPNIWFYQKVPKLMFPIFWFQQNFTMSGEVADKFRILLRLPDFGVALCMIVICLGLVLGILALYNFLRERRKEPQVIKMSEIIKIPEEVPLRS
ncbi:protein croquemort-like isoform X2 [Agrilus planipennis]|uniref:Protein croquemort-like isoform X2 n=1 Tax=Agrilus planipennis TaxID=224129 RepID=A0A1W4WM54_AGRPL|nr:protein croquemort-like isoform X2 [Agrilus planipennis]